jgi:nucleoside-diphosphate-sugar epimerase
MNILVIGGTRYFGIPMVNDLLKHGHKVTIATRGNVKDSFDDNVSRITLERTNPESMGMALKGKKFDVVIDKIAYSSNEIKYVLDAIGCDKYIYMSSTSVYTPKHWNTREEDFDAMGKELVWCSRMDFSYEEIKRQAECALWQAYKNVNAIAVRFPFVIGEDDYTKRLLFYIEHTIKEIPMKINNVSYQMSYIRSDEAGKFIAFLVDKDYVGALNGCSNGTISIREILDYVEQKTGKKAIISKDGEDAPYNDEPEYSINTDRARNLGFQFTNLKDWIYELIDYYVAGEALCFKI